MCSSDLPRESVNRQGTKRCQLRFQKHDPSISLIESSAECWDSKEAIIKKADSENEKDDDHEVKQAWTFPTEAGKRVDLSLCSISYRVVFGHAWHLPLSMHIRMKPPLRPCVRRLAEQ